MNIYVYIYLLIHSPTHTNPMPPPPLASFVNPLLPFLRERPHPQVLSVRVMFAYSARMMA